MDQLHDQNIINPKNKVFESNPGISTQFSRAISKGSSIQKKSFMIKTDLSKISQNSNSINRNRLFHIARNKQKIQQEQDKHERMRLYKTKTDLDEEFGEKLDNHTNSRVQMLEKLLRVDSTSRVQFQSLVQQERTAIKDRLENKTRSVIEEINRTPMKNRPTKRQWKQNSVTQAAAVRNLATFPELNFK